MYILNEKMFSLMGGGGRGSGDRHNCSGFGLSVACMLKVLSKIMRNLFMQQMQGCPLCFRLL